MKLKEVKGDLFNSAYVGPENYLVHCISNDLAMGAGIAKQFTARGVKDYLKANYKPKWEGIGYTLYAPIQGFNGVYNLVTKDRYYMKPTYYTLEGALDELRCCLPDNAKIAMPYIGCGLDKLSWNKVKEIITEVFKDTNITITVCSL